MKLPGFSSMTSNDQWLNEDDDKYGSDQCLNEDNVVD